MLIVGRFVKYRRWSLRLSSVTRAQVSQIAWADGWHLSDFVRLLVVMGAVANWLGLGSADTEVSRMRNELRKLTSRIGGTGPTRTRRYAPRSTQDTAVIGLILPTGMANLLESYVDVRGVSKNDLCGSLLMQGFMIYMEGETQLLKARVPAERLPSESGDTDH
ncbi:MAG TPA: hypothetical protein VEI80_03165 [Candidatus Acidoferrales bacterium]|nr:hypothetical protein [Candidatus Acidoferrales bacterium]